MRDYVSRREGEIAERDLPLWELLPGGGFDALARPTKPTSPDKARARNPGIAKDRLTKYHLRPAG